MTDPLDFSGKTVLVIGGSSGIGNGIAQNFLARGASVHITGTRATAADYAGVDGSHMDGLHYQQLDVTDRAALDAYKLPGGTLDVLVLSQGIVLYDLREYGREGWDDVMDVNINSVMDCARKFHPDLRDTKGALIILNSIASFNAMVGNPAYAASKAGSAALTKTLAQAWSRDGIRVNGIAPGFVETKMTTVVTKDEKRSAGALKMIPLHRYGTPDEMAGVAMFLASPMSTYVVGQTIIADGGMTL
ncbi:SDR family oxidoreductase [Altererythrobacter sp. ZODW24]|uniref:SDR family NAD(P)-dependent oxidoreductase n=1 Tax=Altererythrobacter sp. ZODW24 TaxID=2185142 RepID=UPI000DF77D43|nr:SDR family oxidoreductase [Altererythrobacter sp. ZODW24]